MTPRRILALLLLLVTGLAQGETVWGELRDGEVHHESAAAALAHAAQTDGDHGHEDARTPEHRHGEDHQHGTNADHCTHHHGTAMVTAVAFFVPSSPSVPPSHHPSTSSDGPPTGFFHPPRA